MADPRPELLFVRGPQAGHRAVVMKDGAVVGRGSAADIRLAEQHASRQHARLLHTVEGWIVENVGSSFTCVNGKKYKSGKQILLDTGDVIGIGLQTEALFVAPGDDPDGALAAWKAQHADAPDAAPDTESPIAPDTPAPDEPPTTTVPDADAPAAPAAAPSKMRKYALFAGLYLVGMVVLVAVLLSLRGGGGSGPSSDLPKVLAPADIADALRAPLRRAPNAQEAAARLETARALAARTLRDSDLHNAVKNFKLHLAYLGAIRFEDPAHDLEYDTKLTEMIRTVTQLYQEGWIREKDGKWEEAHALWEKLLALVSPDAEWDSKEYEALHRNIWKHAGYTRSHMAAKRRGM